RCASDPAFPPPSRRAASPEPSRRSSHLLQGVDMSHLPGKFVWFEHVSNDIPKARGFYETLFGWHMEAMPMPGGDPYSVIHNGAAGIGGYSKAPPGVPNQWLSYLSVDDVDASYRAALAAGAKSLMAPMDYGSAGPPPAPPRPSATRPAASSRSGKAPRAIPPTARRRRSAPGSGTSSRRRTTRRR